VTESIVSLNMGQSDYRYEDSFMDDMQVYS